jgi:hypothetical protein
LILFLFFTIILLSALPELGVRTVSDFLTMVVVKVRMAGMRTLALETFRSIDLASIVYFSQDLNFLFSNKKKKQEKKKQ